MTERGRNGFFLDLNGFFLKNPPPHTDSVVAVYSIVRHMGNCCKFTQLIAVSLTTHHYRVSLPIASGTTAPERATAE
jgi:hypothetical protein